ncbi:MAG: hypothetical protein CFE24_09505 [Flavobacterium sp. BFFFF2]|nr:MAG: hypothetical protein CFE24_09505 [Flavobacterium sp. BFFFF2]
MRSLLVLILFVFQLSLAQTKGAKIEFKQIENTLDFGTVNKDEDNGIRYFEFTNTGDEPLVITNAQSTCGCTVPSFPKEPIAPGGTGKIQIKYNMNPGPIRKTITIESNAINTEGGMVALKIKGEVVVKPIVSPLEKKKSAPMQ